MTIITSLHFLPMAGCHHTADIYFRTTARSDFRNVSMVSVGPYISWISFDYFITLPHIPPLQKKQLVCSFFPQPQHFYPYLMVDIYAYCHQWHSGFFHLGRRLCPLQVGSSSRQARIPDGYHGHYSCITPHKAAKKE